jgi:hypothetical protein
MRLAGGSASAKCGLTSAPRLLLALEEARIAIEFAGAVQSLMHFTDIDLPEILLRRADSAAVRLIPEWARRLGMKKDDKSRELCRTIRAFADSNFNVKQTAG